MGSTMGKRESRAAQPEDDANVPVRVIRGDTGPTRAIQCMAYASNDGVLPLAKWRDARRHRLVSQSDMHVRSPATGTQEEVRSVVASRYAQCLDTASRAGITALGFCCSVRGSSNADSAAAAVRTVVEWQRTNSPCPSVVFVTFSDEDQRLHQRLVDSFCFSNQ